MILRFSLLKFFEKKNIVEIFDNKNFLKYMLGKCKIF